MEYKESQSSGKLLISQETTVFWCNTSAMHLKKNLFFLFAERKKNLSLNEIAAQAWLFYTAGFETSSSTMSFCLYELANNLDIQQKVQEEIDEVTARYNGEITYDSIMEMCVDGKWT